MMKKSVFIVLAVAFAAIGWHGNTHAADTIKIGFNAPLTGFAASDGKSASEGAKLAVEQINSAGGVNGKMLELVIYDDQAKPAQAIPIANKLIGQDKVVMGVSGSYSGPTRSAAGVYQEADQTADGDAQESELRPDPAHGPVSPTGYQRRSRNRLAIPGCVRPA